MVCPQCGTQMPDDTQFCPACGRDMRPPAPPVPVPAAEPPAPAPQHAAPVAPSYTAAPAPVVWPKASVFARIVAYVIDGVIAMAFTLPAGLWLAADLTAKRSPLVSGMAVALGSIWLYAYWLTKDGWAGASLGKRIVGLMVVSLKDGRPAGVGQSFVRALVLWVLSVIDMVFALVDAGGQRLGDKLAKTQVVSVNDYRAAYPGHAAPGKGLAIGLFAAALVVSLVGGGVAGVAYARAIGDLASGAGQDKPADSTTPAPAQPEAGTSAEDEAAIKASEQTVNDFYAAINAGDLEKIKSTVVPEVRADIDAGMFEGWSATTFEFTRGWVDRESENAPSTYIIGRESQQQYGAGDNGGVKFTLSQVDGRWLIADFQAVDTTQVEGSDTTGISTGVPGALSEATARDLITQLLDARKVGAGNIIRRLATETFLNDNGDVWLDGMDNSQYFTSYTIDSVKVTGKTATVVVTENWPDGAIPTTYGLVEQNGAVLVDTWEPQ